MQVVTLSVHQLREIVSGAVNEAMEKARKSSEEKQEAPTYWKGLSDICKAIGCSKAQAIWYKKNVFAEAVMQCGRTILVDRDKALALFAEYDRKKMKR